MRIFLATMGLAVAMFHASPALCQEPDSPLISQKRQMVICMNKRMAADKALSYNAAQKDCKDRGVTRTPRATTKRALAANATNSADAPLLNSP